MTFSELQTELYARGFDFLSQDAAGQKRAKRWLNEAYLEDICADEPFDFLRTTASGTAPLAVSDLDTIISVRDSTNDNPLYPEDPGLLEDYGLDLADTGNPSWYYVSGQTTVDVYPANTTNTIVVRYFKVPVELVNDSDTPLLPNRWHGLIVDAAVVRAYADSDNWEAAAFAQQRFDRRMEKLKAAELSRGPSESRIQTTDYLHSYGWNW